MAILAPLGEMTSAEAPNEAAELAFVRALGREEPESGVEAVLRLLRNGPFLPKLADQLYSSAASLSAHDPV